MLSLSKILSLTLRRGLAISALFSIISVAAAQQSGVTLYGILDLGITYESVQRDARQSIAGESQINQSVFGMSNGVQSGSRWGLRGVEWLGDGVSVDFTLEGGFNPAQGVSAQGGRLFGRQSTLGLSMRDVGRLDIGRQINLASNYFLNIDPFAEGFGQANIGASFGSANTTRYGNMVLVQAKPLGGLTLGAGYSFATELSAIYTEGQPCVATQSCSAQAGAYNFASSQNLRAVTLGAHYKNGPVEAALVYDKLYGDTSQTDGGADPSAWILGGAYDFNTVRVALAFGRTSNGFFNGQSSGTGSVTPSGLSTISWDAGVVLFLPGAQASSYMVGLSAPLSGQTTLLASWQMMQPQGLLSGNLDYKTQQIYSAALTQQLSPRTNVYAYTSYGQNLGMINTAESFMIGVGIRHKF